MMRLDWAGCSVGLARRPGRAKPTTQLILPDGENLSLLVWPDKVRLGNYRTGLT